MANGRLARCTINPYSAGLVYENTSGSAASISVNAQLKSKEDNTDITVALEATSRTVATSCTAQTVCAPINCLASIVTCGDGTYAGFYGANGGCFMPLYTNTSGTVTCYPYLTSYFDCITFWAGGDGQCGGFCACCYCCTFSYQCQVTSTPSNAALVVNRNAYENPKVLSEERSAPKVNAITFNTCGTVRFYTTDILTTEEQRARNFVNPTCTSLCAAAGYSYVSAAVDYWASCPSVYGTRHYAGTECAGPFFYGIDVTPFWCCCTTTPANSFYRLSAGITACRCTSCSGGFCTSVASHFGYNGITSSCGIFACTDTLCTVACCGSGCRPYMNFQPALQVFICECAPLCVSGANFFSCCVQCAAYKVYSLSKDVQTSNKGPFWLSGCGVQVVKNICADCSYTFTGYLNETPFTHINGSSFCCVGTNKGYVTLYTGESTVLTTCFNCTCNLMIYPMKWLSYNPVANCNYFMYFGADKSQRGIYSVNQSKIRCSTVCLCTVDGYLCFTGFGCAAFDTFFAKVSCLPAPLIDCDPNNFCPTPIFRTEKCGWRFSVNDAGTWKEYCSNNMVNWYARTSFYTQYSGGSYATTGTAIVRCCDCFFNVIDNSTYLDYQLTANNYERTGLVVSNNDKIYVHNPSGYELAVNVWGYEG